uniref:KIN, antigenic determinant of recA protein homolog n=1 Tax=Caligus rogercresseyi TaxID=217165 RepID=C1BRU3_CALRO|nr:KIN, antigenic determinant of recA protein homolog [Caligus rogercresseyi]
MGKKAEVGTPKYLANKMKSKGLQKLRWYCQMCQKQCRDENGFKCHTMSESHQRQLLLFAEKPNRFLGEFSQEFESGFMNLLKRRFGTKRVNANQVYQEYIKDKDHVHMNGTRWSSLTGFVLHLGRCGKAKVDDTEKGWYIAWIDRDPDTIARQEALAKKDKMVKDDEERLLDFISKQVERAKDDESSSPAEGSTLKELKREHEDEKLQLDMKLIKKVEETKVLGHSVFKKPSDPDKSSRRDPPPKRKKISALDEIKEEIESKKKLEAQKHKKKKSDSIKDHWLVEGIVVKIVTKSLGDKYYKAKGVVKSVVDRYGAVVSLIKETGKIKLDQEHLETVVPSPGRNVLVLNGLYRGEVGVLKSILVEEFSALIELKEDGSVVKIPYEHFSKLFDS